MTKWLMRWCAAALLMMSGVGDGLWAAPFVSPAEDVVVFRRDRLPLAVDSMTEVAEQLLVLAKAQGGAGAADRRGVAQMLALALALKPGADEIRRFAERFEGGRQQADADRKGLAEARTRIWRLLEWLDAPDAGADAHALAGCLGDVMVLADPEHPRAGALRKHGERGAWNGWVKPLSAFKIPAQVATQPPANPPDQPPRVEPSEPEQPDLPDTPLKLATATLDTVVWVAPDATKPRKLIVMPLVMQAALHGKGNPEVSHGDQGNGKDGEARPEPPAAFSCKWVNPKAGELMPEETKVFEPLERAVRKTVEQQAGPLPAAIRMSFRPETNLPYRLAKDPGGVSGVMAVLMRAAVSGIEPQGIVIGDVRDDGSFRLCTDFWERLRSLSGQDAGGRRLVVPAEAEPFLSAVLAMEDPGFFLDYEVLYAETFDQLIAHTARKSDAALAEATAGFAEIRAKRGNQTVAGYVGNRFIRQRLEEIARSSPCHASTRMLAIQGAGRRPTQLETRILARELLAITRSTNWVAKLTGELEKIDPTTLNDLSDAGRDALKAMERYAELRDRELVDQANDLMIGLRTFSRVLRKRKDANGDWVDHSADLKAFKELHQRITDQLQLAARDEP